MEQEEFIKFLQQHAELTVKRVAGVPSRQPTEPETVYRNGYEFVVDKTNNPTQQLEIKRLKHRPRVCEDCRLVVENRVVSKKVYQYPERHWRESCQPCGRTRNPLTGEFDVETEKSQPVFITFFLNRDK